MGSRCRWYLDLSNEACFDDDEEMWKDLPEYYKECPRIHNYEIGSYGHESEDTMRFIKDRLKWAETIHIKEIKVTRQYLKALKKWDLKSDLPPDSYFNIF